MTRRPESDQKPQRSTITRGQRRIVGTSHPVSRVLYSRRSGDHPSVSAVADTLQPNGCAAYPDARAGSPRTRPRPLGLLGLAPGGVCPAVTVTDDAVVSCTAVSPLPVRGPAVCSLWHCPAGRPGWVLPTTMPSGARTFLDSNGCRDHPGGSSSGQLYNPESAVRTRIRSHSSQRSTSSSPADANRRRSAALIVIPQDSHTPRWSRPAP